MRTQVNLPAGMLCVFCPPPLYLRYNFCTACLVRGSRALSNTYLLQGVVTPIFISCKLESIAYLRFFLKYIHIPDFKMWYVDMLFFMCKET
jgi:hypothetical protein